MLQVTRLVATEPTGQPSERLVSESAWWWGLGVGSGAVRAAGMAGSRRAVLFSFVSFFLLF